MKKQIDRRAFLKAMGASAVAVTGANLAGCTTMKEKEEFDDSKAYTDAAPAGKMTVRTNPNAGDQVSILGYGCMRWPTMPDPADTEKQVVDQEQVNQLVDYALAHGVNYFDTAPVYCQGKSEEVTGIALKRHSRESFFVATKLSNQRIESIPDITVEEIYTKSLEMYRNSFEKLQVDYIDYYLLHTIGGGEGLPTLERRFFQSGVLDFLVEEKKKGKIRNLGWSFHGDVKVFDYMLQLHDEGRYHWDFVQIQMNYVDWHHAAEVNPLNVNGDYLYNELHKRGIMAVIMEPLLGGRLSNLPNTVVAKLKQRDPETSVASWAFRFAGSPEGVLTVLSGMTYMEHLKDNLRTFSPLRPLSVEEYDFLEDSAAMIANFPLIQCNDCKYCMPCPYGINIPAVFVHYNKCVNEGNVPTSTKNANYDRARKIFLVGYDRSVPKLRQASHCIGCNQCSPDCPQRIDIPNELQRIDKFVENLRQGTLGMEDTEA